MSKYYKSLNVIGELISKARTADAKKADSLAELGNNFMQATNVAQKQMFDQQNLEEDRRNKLEQQETVNDITERTVALNEESMILTSIIELNKNSLGGTDMRVDEDIFKNETVKTMAKNYNTNIKDNNTLKQQYITDYKTVKGLTQNDGESDFDYLQRKATGYKELSATLAVSPQDNPFVKQQTQMIAQDTKDLSDDIFIDFYQDNAEVLGEVYAMSKKEIDLVVKRMGDAPNAEAAKDVFNSTLKNKQVNEQLDVSKLSNILAFNTNLEKAYQEGTIDEYFYQKSKIVTQDLIDTYLNQQEGGSNPAVQKAALDATFDKNAGEFSNQDGTVRITRQQKANGEYSYMLYVTSDNQESQATDIDEANVLKLINAQ